MKAQLGSILSFLYDYNFLTEDQPDHEVLSKEVSELITFLVGGEANLDKIVANEKNLENVEITLKQVLFELLAEESDEVRDLLNMFDLYMKTIGFGNKREKIKTMAQVTVDNVIWLARSSSVFFYKAIKELLNTNMIEVYPLHIDDFDPNNLLPAEEKDSDIHIVTLSDLARKMQQFFENPDENEIEDNEDNDDEDEEKE